VGRQIRAGVDESGPESTVAGSLLLFITAGPITKLFACGEGDSGRHVL
jgi:hypothetical protein